MEKYEPNKEIEKIKPIITFINGLGGTGKSTLVDYFNQNPIEGWRVYDFDKGEYQAPEDQTKHLQWRIDQTKSWLNKAIENSFNGNKTAIFGLSLYPETNNELIGDKINPEDIHYALLTTEPEIRKQRLTDRGTPQHWQGHKDWYDEYHNKIRQSADLEIDTSNMPVEDVAEQIRNWLQNI